MNAAVSSPPGVRGMARRGPTRRSRPETGAENVNVDTFF